MTPSDSRAEVRGLSVGRIAINVVLDGLISGVAAPIARFLAEPSTGLLHPLWFIAGGAIALLVGGLPLRISQQYWRFAGLADLRSIATASVVAAALFSSGVVLMGYPLPSKTFPLIHALVLLVGLGGGRLLSRTMAQRRQQKTGRKRRVLLVGSDQSSDLFIRAIERDRAFHDHVVGLLTGNAEQRGRRIQGAPILGGATDCARVLARLAAQHQLPDLIIVTDPLWRGNILGSVIEAAEVHKLDVHRAPSLTRLTPADRIELQPVALEDLLDRPQVPLDLAGMERLIKDRVILVTGAGGSIGSELVRQIAQFKPAKLLLLDHGEYALWQIDIELRELCPHLPRELLIADVREKKRIESIFCRFHPDLVFHAAALKHVPMVEQNLSEGALTNVIGTRIVADAASQTGTKALVLISTDKAVNPSSVMGASKRCAEIYCQALDIAQEEAGSTPPRMRCVTVRFGNVLGSTGSVVPLFQRQLARGGPLTVTHPEMSRYFMTIPEAVGLVLQASVRGTAVRRAGDDTDSRLQKGGIFVLDMGEPVRILRLAQQMIRLAGLRPYQDVAIMFTGLRPGEKLHEELFHDGEEPVSTDAPGLRIATTRTVNLTDAIPLLDELERAAAGNDDDAVLLCFKRLVPEFKHNIEAHP